MLVAFSFCILWRRVPSPRTLRISAEGSRAQRTRVKSECTDCSTKSNAQGSGGCGIPPLAKDAKDGAPGDLFLRPVDVSKMIEIQCVDSVASQCLGQSEVLREY